jgi:site-specific DNA-methyltransferase (adenine-specific)
MASLAARLPSAGRRRVGGRVRLYHLPAGEALAAIPARSISILLTDPPYDTVDRHAQRGHLRRWFAGSMPWPSIGRLLAVARRKLRHDGVAFVMTNGAGLPEALAAMQHAGFATVRLIVWDKRFPGLGVGLRHQVEYVLVGLLPGSRTLHGVDLVSVAAVGPGTAGRYPTQKPIELGRRLAAIAAIGPGDVVLDPFCGSGALLVGARERGAAVPGCDIARAAIRTAQGTLDEGRPGRASARAPAPPSLEGRRPAGRRPLETRHAAPKRKPKARHG